MHWGIETSRTLLAREHCRVTLTGGNLAAAACSGGEASQQPSACLHRHTAPADSMLTLVRPVPMPLKHVPTSRSAGAGCTAAGPACGGCLRLLHCSPAGACQQPESHAAGPCPHQQQQLQPGFSPPDQQVSQVAQGVAGRSACTGRSHHGINSGLARIANQMACASSAWCTSSMHALPNSLHAQGSGDRAVVCPTSRTNALPTYTPASGSHAVSPRPPAQDAASRAPHVVWAVVQM